MSGDVLGADPEVLDAYATDASAVIGLASPAVGTYDTAWRAFTSAPATPPLAPPGSGAAAVTAALTELSTATTSVRGYAEALRALDADGSGSLDSSEVPNETYLDLFLQLLDDHEPHDVVDIQLWPFDVSLVPETEEQRREHLKRETDRLWELSEDLVDVNNDGTNGEPRQIRLDLNDPNVLDGYSQEDLQQILELHGIDGEDGPLHFLVHGFTTDTDSLETSGDHVADRYHDRGEDNTTVVTVDWDSGNGPTDWNAATGNADDAASALSELFDAVNTSNPAVDIKISAHSLGNKVALSALSEMETPDGFKVDYLAIQPAIPRWGYNDDPNDYSALISDRIDVLTVTINDGDDALNKYIDYGTIHALGEAEADDDAIQDLIDKRNELGLSTTIRDHESGIGDEMGEGHLGLDPDLELNDTSGKDRDGDPLDEVYSDQIAR